MTKVLARLSNCGDPLKPTKPQYLYLPTSTLFSSSPSFFSFIFFKGNDLTIKKEKKYIFFFLLWLCVHWILWKTNHNFTITKQDSISIKMYHNSFLKIKLLTPLFPLTCSTRFDLVFNYIIFFGKLKLIGLTTVFNLSEYPPPFHGRNDRRFFHIFFSRHLLNL